MAILRFHMAICSVPRAMLSFQMANCSFHMGGLAGSALGSFWVHNGHFGLSKGYF